MTLVSKQKGLTQFNEALERADSAIKSVLDGSSHKLDLNALRSSMSAARDAYETTCSPVEARQKELVLLKADLSNRILSMTRAINVALDRRNPEEGVALMDEVTNASAEELLSFYRRACVRFRDTFPGNTRYLGAGETVPRDWSEFKSE